MTRKLLLRITAMTAAGALAFTPATALPGAVAAQIKVEVSLVNLYATVRDKNRRVVSQLEKGDFKVFEDGKEQQIEFFRAETHQPISLGILMDTSGSMRDIFGAEQDAASAFLRRVLTPKDLAMVMTFDTDVDLMADFTSDADRLERAIRRARVHAAGGMVTPGTVPSQSGGTNFYDAVWLGCKEKLSSETGRKALVVLTDAEDTGSRVKLEDALEAAHRTDTVVHVLFISGRTGFGFGGGSVGVARKLAEETGGRMIEIRNERDLERAFDQISEELRAQYTLGYYSTNGARDGAFRKIKVELKNQDLKALTRKGYYAPKG
jgi:VWFA-related protein